MCAKVVKSNGPKKIQQNLKIFFAHIFKHNNKRILLRKLIVMPPIQLKTRIKAIQEKLGVSESGFYDIDTCNALLNSAGRPSLMGQNLNAHIRAVQNFLHCSVDGIVGPETVTRTEQWLSQQLPKLPTGSSMAVSRKSMDLLISFEVSSETVYQKKYQKPIWPGGESGITIGIGYDLGFNSAADIRNSWGNWIAAAQLNTLITAAEKKGQIAKNYLEHTQSVNIPYQVAMAVFYQDTLPSYARRTKKAFPMIAKLPPDAQGALLSLVYNRGESTKGPTRIEMLNIVDLVAQQNLKGIAQEIRRMKRLWEGKNLPGLLDRREKEATMVEQATFGILPEDIIIL